MTIIEKRQLLNLAVRSDLTTFIHRTFQTVASGERYLHNWHVEAMAWHLAECAAGRIKRLLITMPPRYMKSICASVAFPAWVLGRDPSKRIICVSYAADLSGKHARDCRLVIESNWYKAAFPWTRLAKEKNAEHEFETTRRGFRYSTSLAGTLTGRGGSLIIIDDPIKPDEAMSNASRDSANNWYDRTLYSRLNNKRDDAIVLIMQRLHVDDLVAHVLTKEKWVHLNLPLIADSEEKIRIGKDRFYLRQIGDPLHPAREDLRIIEHTKATVGSFVFSSQYQQQPVPIEGAIVKWEWFQRYDQLPPCEPNDSIVQSWDTASKSTELADYSVCSTWLVKGKDYYLVDILREKLAYPELKRRAISQALEYNADTILIEDTGSGTSLIQDLGVDGTQGVPYPIGVTPGQDKITRMSSTSSKIEAGQVHLPANADWLDDFHAELMQFPNGSHDDQVDSLSQFLRWIESRPGNEWWVEEVLL